MPVKTKFGEQNVIGYRCNRVYTDSYRYGGFGASWLVFLSETLNGEGRSETLRPFWGVQITEKGTK